MAADRRHGAGSRAITRIDRPMWWRSTPGGAPRTGSYIAMEYLEGKTLALVSVGRQVSVERMLPIAAQMLSALARGTSSTSFTATSSPTTSSWCAATARRMWSRCWTSASRSSWGPARSLVQTVQGAGPGDAGVPAHGLALGRISPATDASMRWG
ncbi:MAG: hypothetical protein R3F43_26820 [bacterium]